MNKKKDELIAVANENINSLQAQGMVVNKMFESASKDMFTNLQGFTNIIVQQEKEIVALKQENETLKASLKAFEKDVKQAPKKTPKPAKA